MLYLNSCYLCPQYTQWEELFCKDCKQSVQHSLMARFAPHEFNDSLNLYSATQYSKTISRLVTKWKYQPQLDCSELQRSFLRDMAEYTAAALPETHNFQGIIPVPSHPIRSLFETDLSLLWACELARFLKLPVLHDVIRYKHLFSVPQKLRNREQRKQQHLRFTCTSNKRSQPSSVLLADDVCTTGATIEECSKLLTMNGFVCNNAIVISQRVF